MLATATVTAEKSARRTFPREGALLLNDTTVGAWEEQLAPDKMRPVLRSVLARLRSRGHAVSRCPETAANHPALSADTWIGRLGDLESKTWLRGRVLELTFFQNVANVENRNGGQYDFHRFRKMPRTIQIQCVVEMSAVLTKLRELGYGFLRPAFTEPLSMLAVRDAMAAPLRWGSLEDFNAHWDSDSDRKHGTHRFERDETGWPTAEAIGHHLDRDGAPIRNGEMRYIRQDGRLLRGVVRPNMNGNWFVGDFACCSSDDLFRCEDPGAEPRRFVPDQPKRLRAEIDKALKNSDYARVEVLARVLQRR